MSELKYPHLCRPITLRSVLFRNRMFAAPTGYRNMTYDSILPREAVWYYARKAMGGAASVSTGELVVDTALGRGGPHHICIDNPQSLLALGKIANAVSRYGAVPTAELQHAGMYANRALAIHGSAPSGDAYGPVELELDGRIIRAMTERDIEAVIGKYAAAARSAVDCGFRMILVHAGHGWFLHQFLSPSLNTRRDKWGGPGIENRARLTVEICRAIRKTIGAGIPIEVRISGSECFDGGYGIEEGIAFARQLDGHADLIHVSVGNHEVFESFPITHPSMFLGDGCNVGFAAEIKKHVKTPVATIGALGEPEMMEEIVASGKADVVEMARGLIADPDLPNKIRAGRDDEIRWCMRCLHCFSSQMNHGVKYCPVNPSSGYEHDEIFRTVRTRKKKVLVVGGGTGGLQAALTCAEQGHEVILCEKSGDLGGAILCETAVPFKKKLGMYLAAQARALEKTGVELRLNTKATPEYADSLGADVVLAALGSRPVVPDIPGIGGGNVLGAETAYRYPERVGDRAVVIGAGLAGLELALYLSLLGKTVCVVEAADKLSDGGNMLHANALMIQLKNRDIPVRLNTGAAAITRDGVVCRTADGERLFEADTAVYAVGQSPLRDEALAFGACAGEFYMLGDCVSPGNIAAATGQAYQIALNIGRT